MANNTESLSPLEEATVRIQQSVAPDLYKKITEILADPALRPEEVNPAAQQLLLASADWCAAFAAAGLNAANTLGGIRRYNEN